ncbi:nucleoporin NUP42 [Thalassophryne amazonica]|uniref:nucleoporin NUP42 n=1 Tax=Thalassophryne amazonica TaxID=390379 RepID=UPI0014721947|nr:nucleoporin NUP42 [Thalassophryne amazonica]
MTVCSYFLQGRCRYGEKCWNEHPRDGRGGGGEGYSNSYSESAPRRSREGFGNRVWVNPNQRSGRGFIQPPAFPSHNDDSWNRSSQRGDVKSSEFSFSTQNRFSSLSGATSYDKGGRGGAEDKDDEKLLETVQLDMESWESSGQWGFSCYAFMKTLVSGFSDVSPEELRLEFYLSRVTGDLQSYFNGVNQLLTQWRSRVQELKVMSPPTRIALLKELHNTVSQGSSNSFGSTAATGFGSSTSSFGAAGFGAPAQVQANSFSFKPSRAGFDSAAAPASSSGFAGVTSSSAPFSGFGSSAAPSAVPSASTFSFASPATAGPVFPSGSSATAGSAFCSASEFSFSSASNKVGFGGGFWAEAPVAAGSSSVFGQSSGGFGSAVAAGAGTAAGTPGELYSLQSALTAEEVSEFKAKQFTVGQIPHKPPPSDILMVN